MKIDRQTSKFLKRLLSITDSKSPTTTVPMPVKWIRVMCGLILEDSKIGETKPNLTDVERNVLYAIKADIDQGIRPSIRSVAKRLGYSAHSSAQFAIDRLVQYGLVRRAGKRRQIELVSLD